MTTKYPNAKQFKRELDGDRLEQRYLFLGEEEGEKDKCINRIMVMAFDDPGERSHASGRYHIENDEFLNGADFILSTPLFSSKRVCVMYNIDSLASARQGSFQEMVRDIPGQSILILTTREVRPPAFMAPVLDRFKVVQFWRYFDNDIYNYIIAAIRKLGLRIDENAVDLLVERTGNDIKKIDDAIDMIRYSGETGTVDADLVKNCIDDVKDASVFDLVDALFRKDARALALCRKVREDETPELRILYLILRQAEMLETFYALVADGVPPEEAMSRAGVYSKNKEKFWRYTEAFPRDRLRSVFARISGTDYSLKSGTVSKDLIASPVFNLVSEMLFIKQS
jgi:DNA polymerase III subunit delta